MTAQARPGGYSAGLVAYIISNWPHLSAAGYLPRKSWKLASRRQRDRTGGASFELPSCYRTDVEAALGRLDPETRRVIDLQMEGLSSRAMGVRLDVSYTTALKRVDQAIQRLTDVMNGVGGEMAATATKPKSTNGTNGAASQELERLYDALERKVSALPANWSGVIVKRSAGGGFSVRVVY